MKIKNVKSLNTIPKGVVRPYQSKIKKDDNIYGSLLHEASIDMFMKISGIFVDENININYSESGIGKELNFRLSTDMFDINFAIENGDFVIYSWDEPYYYMKSRHSHYHNLIDEMGLTHEEVEELISKESK